MTSELVQPEQFKTLLLQNVPLLDVRAPVEFAHGTIPGSVNVPLLNDEERAAVGVCFKNEGQAQAIELGHQLVSGTVKETRLKNWQMFFQQHPNAVLYCFRGGLRSKITQQWLREIGVVRPRVEGGYKALRNFLIQSLPQSVEQLKLIIIAGRTGSRKTTFIKTCATHIDLEALACHKGSAFGGIGQTQPTVIDFENRLAVQLLQRCEHQERVCVLEDEGAFIGSLSLPKELYTKMQSSPAVLLDCDVEERVQNTLNDYVLSRFNQLQSEIQDEVLLWQTFENDFFQSLQKIQRRLGGALYQEIQHQMQQAFASHRQGDFELHTHWIRNLLVEYYDRLYDHQMHNKMSRVVYSGNRQAVEEFLNFKK